MFQVNLPPTFKVKKESGTSFDCDFQSSGFKNFPQIKKEHFLMKIEVSSWSNSKSSIRMKKLKKTKTSRIW